MVRRVRLNDTVRSDWREGLLVWRRPSIGGPQDLMIEERSPIEGWRTLVEYRPAADFQWTNAKTGWDLPQLGHRNLAGLPGQLVRSVTTERLFNLAEKRTRHGYDYKLPYYDKTIRSSTGFALLSSFPLDPLPDDPKTADRIDQSVVVIKRNPQRPNMAGGATLVRAVVSGTGAPISETLTSFAESNPTTLCPGIGSSSADPSANCPAFGGLESVFSAPNRTLSVEYPTGLSLGPIFDLGFDGREPWMDRAGGRQPLAPSSACPSFRDFLKNSVKDKASAATGGSAGFSSIALPIQCPAPDTTSPPFAFSLRYPSLYPSSGGTVPQVSETAVEASIKPSEPNLDDQVVLEQVGAYQLLISKSGGKYHWRMVVGGGVSLTSAGPGDFTVDRWQHLVATFGTTGIKFFVDGRLAGSLDATIAPALPSGDLMIGCGTAASGAIERCFTGELGELRVYPQYWKTAPRITDAETDLKSLTGCKFDNSLAPCPFDFGQKNIVYTRNDIATADDDIATEFHYAAPKTGVGATRSGVLGLVSNVATWIPKEDGTPAEYLNASAHWYDGQAFGYATDGNETRVSQFDGLAQGQAPPLASLHIST